YFYFSGEKGKGARLVKEVRRKPLSFREGALHAYLRGLVLLGEGDTSRGMRELARCVSTYPGSQESERAWEKFRILTRMKDISPEPETVLLVASALEGMGKFREAEELLKSETSLFQGKERGEMLLLLADCVRRQGRYEEAVSLLTQEDPSIPAGIRGEMLFYAGVYLWYRGRTGEAISLLERVEREFAPKEVSFRAAYNAGRIHEEAGNFQSAYELYIRASRSPARKIAEESGFRAGLCLYLLGKFREAEVHFSRLSRKYAPDNERFLFFRALSLEKIGRTSEAMGIYRSILAGGKGGLYFFQSLRKVSGKYRWEVFSSLPFRRENPLTLGERFFREKKREGALRRAIKRAFTFLDAGAWTFAAEEMERLFRSKGYGRGELGVTLRFLFGDFPEALKIASRTSIEPLPPVTRAHLLYPSIPIVSRVGEEMGDPFFLHAIMRQESLFDVHAVSSAGAIGLGQIMPATGRRIARSMGMERFGPDLLFFPSVNASFAARHLKGLLRKYGGNRILAAAAYNGGERSVSRWLRKFGGDPYLFPERIGFEETRRYVRRVMDHYLNYLRIYGDGWERVASLLSRSGKEGEKP
ncbi:MAG: hypothetical protein D6713_02285, partial [Deltaproteobacteria bacterium]